MKQHQSGFTLVEIAIVLVIIGLLLGGVLKGQELINNSKVRQVIGDMNAVQTAFYAYQDRYKTLPGDDSLASTRFTGAQNGGGNGAIAGGYQTVSGALGVATESENFWQHVRAANFMKGSTGVSAWTQPNAAVGGRIGIQQTNGLGLTGGPTVCASLESQYAPNIDVNMDDGVGTSGDVRGSPAGALNAGVAAAAVATAYAPPTGVAATSYVVVCKKI